jgi:hypothetical protein
VTQIQQGRVLQAENMSNAASINDFTIYRFGYRWRYRRQQRLFASRLGGIPAACGELARC